MTDEGKQGLGLVAIAAAATLLWLVSDVRLFFGAAVLFAIGRAVLVAKGLLKPAPATRAEGPPS